MVKWDIHWLFLYQVTHISRDRGVAAISLWSVGTMAIVLSGYHYSDWHDYLLCTPRNLVVLRHLVEFPNAFRTSNESPVFNRTRSIS